MWFRNSTIGQGHRRIRRYMFYIANESADGHFKIIFVEKKNFFRCFKATRQRKAYFLIVLFTIPRVIFGQYSCFKTCCIVWKKKKKWWSIFSSVCPVQSFLELTINLWPWIDGYLYLCCCFFFFQLFFYSLKRTF